MHRRSLLAASALGATTGCLGLPVAGVHLEASSDAVALPRDTIRFTLHNDGLRAIETNVHDWHLQKRVDGRWYPLFPFGRPDPTTKIDGRSSYTWTLALDNTDRSLLDTTPRLDDGTVMVAGLGAGRYRFVHRDTGAEPTERTAAFRAEGDRVVLQPDPGVDVTEGEETIVVRDGESADVAGTAITVERTSAGSPGDIPRLIGEQAIRIRPLRITIPLLEDREADRARYLGEQDRARRILLLDDYLGAVSDDTRRFQYGDAVYTVSVADGAGGGRSAPSPSGPE